MEENEEEEKLEALQVIVDFPEDKKSLLDRLRRKKVKVKRKVSRDTKFIIISLVLAGGLLVADNYIEGEFFPVFSLIQIFLSLLVLFKLYGGKNE